MLFADFAGCFVHGLYLEGAGWDVKKSHLIKQRPKQLIQALPVLKIIPIEAHRLKLQVSDQDIPAEIQVKYVSCYM